MLLRMVREIKVFSELFGCVISLYVANDRFNCVVARVKCESEWNVIGVFLIDRFVGHGGGPLERQKQDSHVYRKTGT